MKKAVKRFLLLNCLIWIDAILMLTPHSMATPALALKETHEIFHAIRGQIIDLERKPTAKLQVRLFREDGSSVGLQTVEYDGKFSFDHLLSGRYTVEIEREGSTTLSRKLEIKIYPDPKILSLQIRLEQDSSVSIRQLVTSQNETEQPPEHLSTVSKKALKAFHMAGEASEAGQSAKAIEYLQKAIREQPNYFEAFNNLGVQYQKLKQWPEARQAFEQALNLRKDSSKPYINLGLVHVALGHIDQAIDNLESARQLEPSSALIYSTLGQLYFRKQDYVKAQRYLETTTHLSPKDSRSAFLLLIQLALLNRMPELARQYIEATTQYFPHDPEVAKLEKALEEMSP